MYEEIANEGIFTKISNELAIAKSLKEVIQNPEHPVAKIIYEREIQQLERYYEKIANWDFARAAIARDLICKQKIELIYEKGND